jgi:uncharacterized DUF497 family protein
MLLKANDKHRETSGKAQTARASPKIPSEGEILAHMHRCAYTTVVSYEWDPKKATSNLRKHDIDFADAVTVFEDERALTIDDDYPNEKRFVTIGMDGLARVLVVAFTWRTDNIRIISARKADPQERRQYEEEL